MVSEVEQRCGGLRGYRVRVLEEAPKLLLNSSLNEFQNESDTDLDLR